MSPVARAATLALEETKVRNLVPFLVKHTNIDAGGTDGFGGYGGSCHDSDQSKYTNYGSSVPAGGVGGQGESKGSDGCHSRSGGGGGGYGGGGGGDGHTHTAPSCQLTVCGGGGGGSFALLPAFEDSAAPTSKGDVSSLTGKITVNLHYGYYIRVTASLVTMNLVISAPKSGTNMKVGTVFYANSSYLLTLARC